METKREALVLAAVKELTTARRNDAGRWAARCKSCGADLGAHIDEFGTWEARWVHIRSFDHTFKAIGNAAVSVGNEFSKFAAAFNSPVQNTYGPAPTRATGRRTKSDQVNLRVR